jgi:hypothetical protein
VKMHRVVGSICINSTVSMGFSNERRINHSIVKYTASINKTLVDFYSKVNIHKVKL